MSSSRELFVTESPAYARAGEGIYWQLDTTNYGGSPTSVSVAAYDIEDDNAVVTDTVLSGSATVNGDDIALPLFLSAVKGKFKIIVTFTNARFAPAKPELDVIVVN